MFGTCIDGEAELLGMEGGRRMSIREQMAYPFTEAWNAFKDRSGKHRSVNEQFGMAEAVAAE
jgi:hypothetical protein